MNRRSFFGAAAASVAAAPAALKEAAAAPAMETLSLALDAKPLLPILGEIKSFVGSAGGFHPFFDGRRYVHYVGVPAIDALRSVSGVHKALMEKRLADGS